MNHRVFVNRTLNLKKIKYIGFDMDHTLIRYNTRAFEALAHGLILDKLVNKWGYPKDILELPFDFDLAIRGLVLDRKRGNLLKLSRHGAIRVSYHGTQRVGYKQQQEIYRSTYVDLNDPDVLAVDTTFSISLATLFAQLVDFKDQNPTKDLPDYKVIGEDVLNALDESHRDNTLKGQVQKDLDRYVLKIPEVAEGLEHFKRHGKKLFLLTNSDFHYTKLLLQYAIEPYLKEHKCFDEVFEYVITFAKKPRFFVDKSQFLKVNPEDGTMTNWDHPLQPGVYQGGCANLFTGELNVDGDEILYIGDHIYGDILRLKKTCNWRTAMVLEELEAELKSNATAEPINDEIEKLMHKKEPFENQLTEKMTLRVDNPGSVGEEEIDELIKTINDIDSQISDLIVKKQALYNKRWGQLMRAGNEESYLAYQVDRYACIYMPTIADLLQQSPRTYFRAYRRPLAHELNLGYGDGLESSGSDRVF